MGCGGSKEFDTTELGARTVPFAAEQCFDGQAAPSTTGTYQSSLNVMKMQMDYSSLSGKAISVSGRAISLVNKEYEMIDHDGKRVSVTKGATLQMIPLQMHPTLHAELRWPGQRVRLRRQGSGRTTVQLRQGGGDAHGVRRRG